MPPSYKLDSCKASPGASGKCSSQARDAGFEVMRDRRGSENGFCDFVSHTIGVRPDVEGLQAVKTLVHELGHALLHKNETPSSRAVAEVEVESVAFIVLDALGLNSGDYSFPYVTRWSAGQTELMKQTAQRAVTCAAQILSGLDSDS